MLKKIDVYIIKKFLSTFFFTMCLITVIAIAMDFFEKVDKFLAPDVKIKDVVLKYFLNFIPWINGLLWPLFALLSVIFFTSRMAKDNEIISALSSGISYNRLLRPFFVASGVIAFFLWIGNNYVIPNSTRIKNEFEGEYIKRGNKKTLSSDIHFWLSPTEKAYFRYYSQSDSSARNFRIETFDSIGITKILKSEEIRFIDSTGKWKMKGFELHNVNGLDEKFFLDKSLEKDSTFVFKPEDFVKYAKQMEMMTSSELRSFMKEEERRGLESAQKYRVELLRRTADPFTIIILTIIGACIASRKVRGGMGIHLAFGVILGSIFVILSKFSITFVTNLGMPEGVGVWLPNIIFSFVSYFLYTKAQK
jgi:lipopolysaccharide export system permease protein